MVLGLYNVCANRRGVTADAGVCAIDLFVVLTRSDQNPLMVRYSGCEHVRLV
jgi:hypothetical protein